MVRRALTYMVVLFTSAGPGVLPAIVAQTFAAPFPGAANSAPQVVVTIVDENNVPVAGAQLTFQQPGDPAVKLESDYAGRCAWLPRQPVDYTVHIAKPGFYEITEQGFDPLDKAVRITITHEQVLKQQINVQASTPRIDPEQTANQMTLTTAEVVNLPFPVNRDVRNLLPFTPEVVADSTGQVHVAGGRIYMTEYTLDGFDIRSPITGALDLRVSTDAVRSIDIQSTRYPVQYGRSTAGVIAFGTGMGDNKFRYNSSNFIPSFRQKNGIHFDKFEPRFTASGPIVPDRAWFFEAAEFEYDNIYIPELPLGADTNHLLRGSNLAKAQTNITAANKLNLGLLLNGLHSPYDGISALVPQDSTDKHDIAAWLPYARDQHEFGKGALLETGVSVLRYREGVEPHGSSPYTRSPDTANGSFYENLTSRALREQGYVRLYLPETRVAGSHQVNIGGGMEHTGFDDSVAISPISYLREDGTLSRRSTYPRFAPFGRHNLELSAYAEDHWAPRKGVFVEPGLRWDWDEIVARPLFSPRIAANYSPPGAENNTKLTAGIGLYYEHTQLEYLTRTFFGTRLDTYYAGDGITPLGPPQTSFFTENDATLHAPRALNWSAGLQQKLPGQIYFSANYTHKTVSDVFVYANQSGTLAGTYALTNGRQDRYYSAEFDARRTFAGGYTLFAAYTRSRARTTAAVEYTPLISILGRQQPGPLAWDVPNRVLSWGWLPAWAPKLPTVHKNWDFVYTLDWRSGAPYTSIDANNHIVGAPGSRRFPNYLSFSPGLEWRFHFRGNYFGLRGILQNATASMDPYAVYNNVDSPQYGVFVQPLGRAFTTRIRLIESK